MSDEPEADTPTLLELAGLYPDAVVTLSLGDLATLLAGLRDQRTLLEKREKGQRFLVQSVVTLLQKQLKARRPASQQVQAQTLQIVALRRAGCSWKEISKATGVGKDVARKRFARHRRKADRTFRPMGKPNRLGDNE